MYTSYICVSKVVVKGMYRSSWFLQDQWPLLMFTHGFSPRGLFNTCWAVSSCCQFLLLWLQPSLLDTEPLQPLQRPPGLSGTCWAPGRMVLSRVSCLPRSLAGRALCKHSPILTASMMLVGKQAGSSKPAGHALTAEQAPQQRWADPPWMSWPPGRAHHETQPAASPLPLARVIREWVTASATAFPSFREPQHAYLSLADHMLRDFFLALSLFFFTREWSVWCITVWLTKSFLVPVGITVSNPFKARICTTFTQHSPYWSIPAFRILFPPD